MKEGNFMRIALIQMKANDIKDYEKCAEHILKMINYAAEKKPDMVLLPECAYPGYIIDDKESLKKALEKEESFLEKFLENPYKISSVKKLPMHNIQNQPPKSSKNNP